MLGKKVAIFVHGCFWHAHAGCPRATTPKSNTDFWQAKLVHNVERDRIHLDTLQTTGWRVLVVWECATRGKPNEDALCERIADWLRGDRAAEELGRADVGNAEV